MDKKQQFRTEFLTLCDLYEIDASEMGNEFLDKVADIAIPLGAEVKPATCEHNFQIAKRDYYKPDGGQNAFGKTYDQSRTYSTLFCTKCGETKEIITS